MKRKTEQDRQEDMAVAVGMTIGAAGAVAFDWGWTAVLVLLGILVYRIVMWLRTPA